MIYFDNAATGGTKPKSVISAVQVALQHCANAGRSGHKQSLVCANIVQNARSVLSDFFHGYGPDRTVFTKNCTEALNIAIFSALSKGGNAVTTCLEHNSVLRPLEELKRRGTANYTVVPLPCDDFPEAIKNACNKDTKAVIVTAASNVTGACPDLSAIKRAIPPDVLFIVDGAQACGHIPVSLKNSGIDALAVAGHKGMHAIQGAGALLFSPRFSPSPILFGGTGSDSLNLGMPPFYPDLLESGTLNFPAISSLFEGTLYAKLTLEEDGRRLLELTTLLWNGLKNNPHVKLYSEINPVGIVSFLHEKYDSEEVATILSDEYNIAVRGGLHCAPLIHRALKTQQSGLVRISLSAFNTREEIAFLLRALRRI